MLRTTNRLFLSIIGTFFAGLTLVFLLASARLVMAPVNLDWASSAIIWFLTPEGKQAQIEIENPELRLDTSSTSLELHLMRFTYKDVSGYQARMDGFSLKPSISDFVSSFRFLPRNISIDSLVMTVPDSGETNANSSLFVFRDWLEIITNSDNNMGGLQSIRIKHIQLLQDGVATRSEMPASQASYFNYSFINSTVELDADISFTSVHGNSNIAVAGKITETGGGQVNASVSKFRPDELALFAPVLLPLAQIPLPLDLTAEIRFEDDFVPSYIDANLYLGGGDVTFKELNLRLDEVSAKFQVDVASQSVFIDSIYVSYEKNRAEFSGALAYDATRTGRLDKLSGDLVGKALQLNIPDLWETPIRSQQINFSFDLDRADQVFSLAQFRIYLNDLIVETRGEIRIAKNRPDDLEIDLTSQIGPFQLDQVLAVWPIKFAPRTKSWVSNNIKGLTTETGTARFSGLLSEWRKFGTGIKPDPDIIKVEIPFYEGNIRYLSYLPPLENMRGSIFLSADQFHAKASEAQVNLTALDAPLTQDAEANSQRLASGASRLAYISDAQFSSPKFSPTGGTGQASFTVRGDVDALLTALSVPQINALRGTRFVAEDFAGTAEANVELKFPMGRPYKRGSVDYSVSADLDAFAIKRRISGYELSDSRLRVDVTPLEIQAMGIGHFNGVSLNYGYKRDIASARRTKPLAENDVVSSLSLFGTVTPRHAIDLRLPKLAPHFDGAINFNLLLDQYADKRADIRLVNSFTETKLEPLRLNYTKPIGMVADMVASIELDSNQQLVSAQAQYSSAGGDRIQLEATSAAGELSYLNIDPFKLGDAYDFQLTAGQTNADRNLAFRGTGAQFDISKLIKAGKLDVKSAKVTSSPAASKTKPRPNPREAAQSDPISNSNPNAGANQQRSSDMASSDMASSDMAPAMDVSKNVKTGEGSLISSLAVRLPQNSSFDIRIAELQGANGLKLDSFTLAAIRVDGRLEKLQSSSVFSSGSEVFANVLRGDDGKRTYAFQAENAGELLSALGYLDGMENGALSMTGSIYDAPINVDRSKIRLDGDVVLSEFKVRDLPVLAQLLSLASFGGIADTLSGNGLRFDGADANFFYDDGRLKIKRAKASGSALGLTLQGAVDYKSDRISLGGNLVPAYVLNSLIGKIPVLGKLFTSREGEGVVGVNYRIFGTASDPTLIVNPLSVFTPGFLRQIFELGVGELPTLPTLGAPSPASTEEPYFTR